jgi:drug/metabolite transporter (DMT)-like permease
LAAEPFATTPIRPAAPAGNQKLPAAEERAEAPDRRMLAIEERLDSSARARAPERSGMAAQPTIPRMLWIPITIAAAALQTVRNAAQRSLTGELSALGATYTRFLFGFPFAALYAAAVFAVSGAGAPAPGVAFFGWAAFGGVAQILGTAFLLQLFQLRNFGAGVAFSKSEIVQVALFGMLVLGDAVTALASAAIAVAAAGLVLMARETGTLGARGALAGLAGRPALLGLGAGAAFAIAAVSFRAASLSLALPFAASAAATLALTTLLQTLLMTVWLRWREPRQIGAVVRAWRRSWLPGLTGAAASACWFTAMTIEIAAYVRMLGLVEVLFGFGVSVLALRQRPGRRELLGSALLVLAIVALLWDRVPA